ncbi:hypothetical protein FRC12_008556 [Ceratobasidium sp. 428]|nr:hypothetical protein FRC09_014848 [Ceratobasidium sp. 395]KAG8763413.1 hypothetical protein FRC12_008556 [Ceratobasidium sp. 428]
MLSRLAFSFFVLSALLAIAMAEHVPRYIHGVDAELVPRHGHATRDLEKRGKPKGTGGTGTWYKPGLGNCGGRNKDSDMIIALPTKAYGNGQWCGKKFKVSNKKNGKSVIVTCVDSCPTCGNNDLDISPKAFGQLAKLSDGVFPVTWEAM